MAERERRAGEPPSGSAAPLRVDVRGAVARVTLDRPERLNALSRRLLAELIDAAGRLDAMPEVRVVVLAGAGRAFSAGFDLDDLAAAADGDPVGAADLGRRAVDALAGLRAVTVAAIRGHCVGGGVVLAAACDLRVAADDARFVIPEAELGLPLGWGGVPRLVRELGPAVTTELVLTCRPFDASEAQRLRLVNRVVPGAELEATVAGLAATLAARPALVLEATKRQVAAAADELVSTRAAERDAYLLVAAQRDPEARAAAARALAARRPGRR